MTIVSRTNKGNLKIETLNLQILIGEMFYEAKTEEEADYIHETLESVVDIAREEALEEMEGR